MSDEKRFIITLVHADGKSRFHFENTGFQRFELIGMGELIKQYAIAGCLEDTIKMRTEEDTNHDPGPEIGGTD